MIHIKERLMQYADKYSGCYKYAGVYVKVIQDMIEQLLADLEQDEKENGWIPVSERLPENEREKVMVMTPSGTTVGWYAKKAFSKGWATEYKKVWHILYFYDIEPWCLTSNFDYYRNPKIYTLENEKVRSLQVLAWKPLKEMFKNFDPCVEQGILEEMKETGEKND